MTRTATLTREGYRAPVPRRRGGMMEAMASSTTAAVASVRDLRVRGRRSWDVRVGRLRGRAFFILQCGVAAGLAWAIARYGLGHPAPMFAAVAAMVTLGMSYGQRLSRAVEIVVGVTVGVLLGDLFAHLFGTGAWQITLVIVLSMGIAVLLGAGNLMATQAGINGAVVITLAAQYTSPLSRWLDALVGGIVALAIATIVPAAPVRRPRQQAAVVLREMSEVLATTATALRTRDGAGASAALERSRRLEGALTALRTASSEGVDVVRLSPFRRSHLPSVQAVAALVEPLDRAIRNTRVLVRRCAVSLLYDEPMPPPYVELVAGLAVAAGDIAASLNEPRPLPSSIRGPLRAVARASAVRAEPSGLSAEVVRAQVRSTVVDLLMLTGLGYDQARAEVPRGESDRPLWGDSGAYDPADGLTD